MVSRNLRFWLNLSENQQHCVIVTVSLSGESSTERECKPEKMNNDLERKITRFIAEERGTYKLKRPKESRKKEEVQVLLPSVWWVSVRIVLGR